MTSVEEILSAMRRSGGRITASRRATVETLLAHPERHMSAEEIVAAVRRRHADVAESTIYRTLATLEELGVITHTHLDHGPATFHLAGQAHRHLVCRHCHAVTETPAEMYTALTAMIEERYGFRIDSEHFALSGLCSDCLARRPVDQAAGGR
jgi:Fur family ferric uptake transcriptional regulator